MDATLEYLKNFETNALRKDWSADAFHCEKCPGRGCPLWWSLTWERTEDGVTRERHTDGCGAALLPGLLVQVLVGQAVERKAGEEQQKELLGVQKQGIAALGAGILRLNNLRRVGGTVVDVESRRIG